MIRHLKFTPFLAAALVAFGATQAQAQYLEIFTEADVAGGISGSFLEAVTVDGGVAYAASRDTTSADTGVVVSYDGSSFTTVMTPAQYAALGSSQDYAAGNGVGVAGGSVRAISFFDNNVLEVNIGTGVVTEVVTKAALDAAAGGSVNMSAVHETQSDGSIFAVDSVTDQVLSISAANAAAVEINTADFAALLGGTSIGGIGVDGNTIYLGSNSSDSLVAWDTTTDTGSTVLTTAEIESVTDDIDGRAGFSDILAAPNGLIYFYESDSDYILSFDPANPAATLDVVLSEEALIAGPAGSDSVGQLAWWNGNLAWTRQGTGFYAVPEPSSALLGGLALTGFLARRRG